MPHLAALYCTSCTFPPSTLSTRPFDRDPQSRSPRVLVSSSGGDCGEVTISKSNLVLSLHHHYSLVLYALSKQLQLALKYQASSYVVSPSYSPIPLTIFVPTSFGLTVAVLPVNLSFNLVSRYVHHVLELLRSAGTLCPSNLFTIQPIHQHAPTFD
jgi:hypothetical protein